MSNLAEAIDIEQVELYLEELRYNPFDVDEDLERLRILYEEDRLQKIGLED